MEKADFPIKKRSKCAKVLRFLSKFSMITYKTGIFNDGRSSFTSNWTILVSFLFSIAVIIFVGTQVSNIDQIENINTFIMKSNKQMIENSTVYSENDLFPWGVITTLNCSDAYLKAIVYFSNTYMPIPGLDDLHLECEHKTDSASLKGNHHFN